MLAERLRATFVDLDDRVRERFTEPTVQDIWRTHGESAWRDAENSALSELLKTTDDARIILIALGGGAPMIPEVRATLQSLANAGHARIVYIRCDPATLRHRLIMQSDTQSNRPPLTAMNDPVAEVDDVFAHRDPTYVRLATHIINVAADQSIESTVDAIMPVLE
jgi:shikimate kinase